nr:MAG TPA: hypothetical protein [Caudoviricetes sp.]
MNIWGISFVATAIAGACMAIGYLAGRATTKTPVIVISEMDVEELRKKWCDDTDELKM